MNKKLAIIVWVWWQDWTILWEILKSKNYNLIWINKEKNIYNGFEWVIKKTNIIKSKDVKELIIKYKPDEIYYLAAYHQSSQDLIENENKIFKKSNEINVVGYFNFLHQISKYSKNTKICYASSCLIYWWTNLEIQDEQTQPSPNSIYWITKLNAMNLWKYFINKYNIKIVNAILYNHESEFRKSKFISMKIITEAIKISKWLQNKIIIWDLNKKVDWWYAWEYVYAMILLLEKEKTWDFIISSWKLHTIQEFIEIVFDYLNLDWKNYIEINKNIIKRENWKLFWNNSKIYKEIWWKPIISFEEMIIKILKKVI